MKFKISDEQVTKKEIVVGERHLSIQSILDSKQSPIEVGMFGVGNQDEESAQIVEKEAT